MLKSTIYYYYPYLIVQVVEDIERLDFDNHTEREDPKMKDWRLPREVDWADKRMVYTNQKAALLNMFNIPRTDVPELIISAEDAFNRDQVSYSDLCHTNILKKFRKSTDRRGLGHTCPLYLGA